MTAKDAYPPGALVHYPSQHCLFAGSKSNSVMLRIVLDAALENSVQKIFCLGIFRHWAFVQTFKSFTSTHHKSKCHTVCKICCIICNQYAKQ